MTKDEYKKLPLKDRLDIEYNLKVQASDLVLERMAEKDEKKEREIQSKIDEIYKEIDLINDIWEDHYKEAGL